jgi:hypothetical protein
VSITGHSPPQSVGGTPNTPSLEESGESMSGASSEGPNSPDSKLATTLEQERVEIIQVQEAGTGVLGLVKPNAGILEKMSGEMTPTGDEGRVHLKVVTMVV